MIRWKGSRWAVVYADRSRVLLAKPTLEGKTITGIVHEYAPRSELDALELHTEIERMKSPPLTDSPFFGGGDVE